MSAQKNGIGYTESTDFRCLEDLKKTQKLSTLTGISLDYYGIERCQPGFQFGPYVRESGVMHIIIAGKGTYDYQGQHFTLHAGQVFYIPPRIETVYRADDEDPWSYLWLGFHGYAVESLLHKVGLSEETPVTDVESTDKITELVLELLEIQEPSYANELMRIGIFYHILSLIVKNQDGEELIRDRKKEPSEDIYVNLALDIITTDYRKPLKINDIAKKIGINRGYLTEIFTRKMKMSPKSYLTNFRMHTAATMLLETDEPIHIIADRVGYPDPLSFSKAFRQKYRISPSEYRRVAPSVTYRTKKGEYENIFPI